MIYIGNFSIVKECTHIVSGKKYAVKCIKKSSLKEKDLTNINREMDILRKVRQILGNAIVNHIILNF